MARVFQVVNKNVTQNIIICEDIEEKKKALRKVGVAGRAGQGHWDATITAPSSLGMLSVGHSQLSRPERPGLSPTDTQKSSYQIQQKEHLLRGFIAL